jgi:hypothetical protein
LRTFTVPFRLAAITAGAVLAFSSLVSAQNLTDLRKHYGDAIGEVYRTSNQLTVTAYFDEHGNICREHIEFENRGRRITDKEVNTVLDEIAPKSDRGTFKIGTFLNIICLPDNDCGGVREDYERLAITKIGGTNEYRYISIDYHSAECKHWEADKKK